MAVVENIIYKVETEGADKFKKDLQDAAKSQQELTNAVESGTTSVKEYNKAMEARKAQLAQLDKESKAYKELDAEIKAAEISVEGLNKSYDTLKKQFADTKKAINGVTYTLSELEKAGLKNTSTYQNLKAKLGELEKQGGELKDQIGDLNTKFKNLGSDTRGVDIAIEGLQGMAAATQVVMGTQALFGTNSKELEQTLVKLNGVMALANGIKEIQTVLQKESALMTGLETAAQTAYAFAVGNSTGAMKVFRIALASTGVGLLVIALGALVANFDKISASINNLVKGSVGDLSQFFAGIAKGIGTAFSAIPQLISDIGNKGLKAALGDYTDKIKKGFEAGKIEKAQQQQTEALIKGLKAKTEVFNREIALLEANNKDSYKKKLEKLQNDKRIAELELSLLDKGGEAYIAKQAEIYQKDTDIQVLKAEKSAKLREEELKKREEESKRLAAFMDARRAAEENFEKQRFERWVKGIEDRQKAEKIADEKAKQDNIAKFEKLLSEDEQYLEELKLIYAEEELYAKDKNKAKLENEADILQRSLEINQNQQTKLFDLKLEQKITTDDFEKQSTELVKKENKLRYDIEANKIAQIEKKRQESLQRQKAAMDMFTEAQNIGFQLAQQNAQNELQTQLDNLDTKKQAELANTDLTEREKEAINKKYQAQEAAVKLKAWKAEQDMKKGQAIMNGALAATNVFANGTPVAWPFLLGLVLMQTAAQVAMISNQKPPKFEKGGSVAKRLGLINGKPHSAGGEIIEVEGNEFVFRKEAVKKYGVSMLEQMNNLQLNIPKEPSRAVAINYNKLGEVIGDKLRENPMLRVSIDKKGINTSIGGTQLMNNYVEF